MYRPNSVALLAVALAAALAGAACDDNDPVTAPDPPVEIMVSLSGRLTPNGAVTHSLAVQRAGDVTARVVSLNPSDVTIGLSLGPLSVQGCSQTIANDAATGTTSLRGTASSAGNFCVRLFDAGGTLTGPVDYELTVTHF